MRPLRLLPLHGTQTQKPSFRLLPLALLLTACLSALVLAVVHGRILLPDLTIWLPSYCAAAEQEDAAFVEDNSLPSFSRAVSQQDASLVYFWQKYLNMAEGSSEKNDAWKQFLEVMAHRYHVDNSVALIGTLLFGSEDGPRVLNTTVRAAGEPLVDDWSCLKSMVRAFKAQCGSSAQYGMTPTRSFANMCNAGILPEAMAKIAAQACNSIPSNPWSSIHKGSSA